MNKVNGYDVVLLKGNPRFRLNNKLIKRELVPIQIQEELIHQVQNKDAVRTVDAAPDVAATFTTEQPTSEPVEIDDEGGDNPYIEAGAPKEFPPLTEHQYSKGFREGMESQSQDFSELELQLIEENQALKQTLAELAPAAKTQTAREMGAELLNAFGIYTALAPREPQVGDVHPFTLKPMNRYDTGLAYAERKKSFGVEVNEVQEVPLPQENPKSSFPSFADRTGVSFTRQSSSTMQHHTNDPINEEATAEPNLRGTTIRPQW